MSSQREPTHPSGSEQELRAVGEETHGLAEGSAPGKAGKHVEAVVDSESGQSVSPPSGVAGARPNVLQRAINVVLPDGGLLSGVLNLASVTLGAGIMSIPSSFNTSGLVMGTIYLVIITALTVLSLVLLTKAMVKTGIYSFEGLARALFGRGGDVFVAVLMWLLCFGGAVGYVIAMGNILTQLLDHAGVPAFLQSASGRRCMMSAVWLVFMMPTVLPKRVNSLRYVSAVGVSFILLFVVCIIWHSAAYGFEHGIRKDLVMVSKGNDAVVGLSIFIFSYLNQVNAGRINLECSSPNKTRAMTLQAVIACTVCGLLYFLAGFFGYAEFGPALSGNIINRYDPYASPIFFVVFIGLIVKLCAAFALNMLACRTALFNIVHWDVDTMPYWKHTIVSVAFAVGALILGLFVPDISIVFGLAGSLCGGFIGFVFPALFVMYAGDWSFTKVGAAYYLATYFLLICGVIAVVFGTGSSIYGTVVQYA